MLTDVDDDPVVLDTLDCEGICHKLYRDNTGWFANEIDSCSLILPERETGVEELGHIICQGIGIEGNCVGRRSINHIEGGDRSCRDVLGRSLAAMAYLEAASVIAFEQLAVQLQSRGAPLQLIFRCRNASNDERCHARWMTVLANQRGAKVPAPALDSQELHSEIQSVAHSQCG